MQEFYPFFLIIFAGVFFSIIFRRVRMPWVVALILGGIISGPQGLNVLTVTPTLEFIGQIGLIFLMFMAGLETKISSFSSFKSSLGWLALINGTVPFCVGLSIGFFFGYGWVASILIGIIFVSSSIAVVIPSLEQHGLLASRLGQSVVMTSIVLDIGSLVMLSILLQNTHPVTVLPLYVFYPLLIGFLVVFRTMLPKIRAFLAKQFSAPADGFQQDFRLVFTLLIGTVLVFEILGLHPIIAGFFAGLVLAESIQSSILREKIRTISYGLFIPTFFIIIGAKTDIQIFSNLQDVAPLLVSILLGSMLSKFLSGWVAARIVGFDGNQSLLFGIATIPQLSTTLAVSFTALSLGFIDQKLITSLVILSIVTTVVSPILMSLSAKRIRATL